MVCRWKCLCKKLFKEFFIRPILLMFQSEILYEFEHIFLKINVIACSNFDGSIRDSDKIFWIEKYCTKMMTMKTKNKDGTENRIDSSDNVNVYLNSLSSAIDQSLLIEGNQINALLCARVASATV